MTVYLDTHVAIYIHSGAPALLSPTATHMLDASGSIRLSPIVSLELQCLHEARKIAFPGNEIVGLLKDQFDIVVDKAGMGDAVLHAAKHTWTREPFDRIITAHAANAGGFLLTRDSTIRRNYRSAIW